MTSDYINAEFYFPNSDITYPGTLHTSDNDMFFVLKENPNGRNSWKTIEMIYAKTANGLYSCVECYLYKTDHYSYFYFAISELYKGGEILTANAPYFKRLVAEIHFLNFWLHPRLHKLEFRGSVIEKVSISDNKVFSFKISDDLIIGFESFSAINAEQSEIILKEKSVFFINSSKDITRPLLFNKFYSFLILFSLFLKKIPGTTKLNFESAFDSLECLNTNKSIRESPIHIIIRFNEIMNMQSILNVYFSKSSEYNSIIQLWQVSFESIDPEISFLHLTQSLELFHKTFHQNDELVRQEVHSEMLSCYSDFKKTKKWVQKMVYHHLYNIAQSWSITVPISLSAIDFINKLTDSRNYYTHYTNRNNHWNHHELIKINHYLKLWVRCLLLNNLGIEQTLIIKVAQSEKQMQRGTIIFENKYSMRYQNWFTR